MQRISQRWNSRVQHFISEWKSREHQQTRTLFPSDSAVGWSTISKQKEQTYPGVQQYVRTRVVWWSMTGLLQVAIVIRNSFGQCSLGMEYVKCKFFQGICKTSKSRAFWITSKQFSPLQPFLETLVILFIKWGPNSAIWHNGLLLTFFILSLCKTRDKIRVLHFPSSFNATRPKIGLLF